MAGTYREKVTGPGTFATKVAGTNLRQQQLSAICGDKSPSGYRQPCTAKLVSEPHNLHDLNAVRIEIFGKHIGYLPRKEAGVLSDWLRANQYRGIEANCDAMIVGGWEDFTMEGPTEGAFGVRLDAFMPEIRSFPVEEHQTEFVFSPMLPTKIKGNRLVWGDEEFLLEKGDPVNLWTGEQNPNLVYIYSTGSQYGGGRIGFVPEPYGSVVLGHRQQELPIEAHIEQIECGKCFIRCRLVSKEEVLRLQLVKKEKARAEFMKPYTLRRPVRSKVSTVDPHVDELRDGDTLLLAACPTVEECLDDIHRAPLTFKRSDGQGVFACSDNELKKRIVRLGEQSKELVVTVLLSKPPIGRSEYDIEVSLRSETNAKATLTQKRKRKSDGSR